jgi:hypothetical protein
MRFSPWEIVAGFACFALGWILAKIDERAGR